jgi:ABC-type uncharacterized transport system substrate-binding protein
MSAPAHRPLHLPPRPLSRRRWLGHAGAWASALAPLSGHGQAVPGASAAGAAGPRILHIMSFDSPWRWTDGQLEGFRQTLAEPQAQWQIFQMDTKRHSSEAARAERGRLARDLVAQWKPDLVYLSDDEAVAQVARPLAGTAVPIVFSGVNRSLADHGLTGAPNITGVLEREHAAETLRLLQALVPGARRLAVVSDRAPYWDTVIDRVRRRLDEVPAMGLTVVERMDRYADFQRAVLGCDGRVDAILYLGVLTLTDADGRTVPYQTVQRWVTEHSLLPDASFWIDRVHHGNLASVTVSELAQGRSAGLLARAILREGRTPVSLPVVPTTQGQPAISLARARQLGLKVSSSLLLSTEVVRHFAWADGARG